MKFRPHSIPERAHPLVRELFRCMNERKVTTEELAWRTGMTEEAFNYWRTRGTPNVTSLEAAFNAVGFKLVVQAEGGKRG